MLFNTDKCKVMHMGCNNSRVSFEMNGKIVESVRQECDLLQGKAS